ncbi:MAG: hypothetical protein M5T52_24040 [Ignavibacteriaceae bacterium]|nr:hypothetical protein [Ignavibacteriaceae bacterium]
MYNDEIKKIIPFSFSLYEGSIIPYIFWILVIVAGFLFFKRQTEDDAARKEIIDELTNTIRTLPPADFLTNFHKIYKETQNALRDASINEISDKNVLDILIRLNLKALLALTKNFDNDMDQTKYGVNIMLFKEVSEINEEYLSEKRGQIKFLDNGIDLKELKGILELNRELSVSSDTILQETPEPDKNN